MIPKIIPGGNGIPDDYCVEAKDFISREECEKLNKEKQEKEIKEKE